MLRYEIEVFWEANPTAWVYKACALTEQSAMVKLAKLKFDHPEFQYRVVDTRTGEIL